MVVTLPLKEWVRLVVESRLHKQKADTDYLVQQRKALAEVIAAHPGRFVDAADRFCHRLVRVSNHASDHWLNPDRPGSDRYFYESTSSASSPLSVQRRRWSARLWSLTGA
jgi:hypothetical protein